MATKALTVATRFTAVDKFSQTMKKMTASTTKFATSAVAGFNRVDRAVRKMRRSLAQKAGKLGLTVGFLALFMAARSVVGVFADYEQANAGLAAVMNRTVTENAALIKDSKRLGAVTAKTATEVVGLQEAFARLGFSETDIINMTQSTIAGSIAMKSELSDTAELVGAMVNSFDDFTSIKAPEIINKLTLATQKSALNFEKLQKGLPIVAGAANAAGIPFTRLLALLGKLSDAGIDTSSSATALRNIFIDSAKKGHSYEQILGNIEKNQKKLTAANDEFGKRTAVSAVILAKNISATNELDKALQNAAGTAETAANKQLDTLNGRLTLLSSAWQGFVLSTDDGTGALSGFLKTSVELITEMLSLASGTAKAKGELDEAGLRIRRMANFATFLVKTIRNLTIVFIAAKVSMFAYNVVLGITGALSTSASIAISSSTVAMNAYKIATGIATAAQWLWNVAMSANPIGLIIIGIAALVAGIVLLIKNWSEIVDWVKTSDNVFAKFIRGSLKPIIWIFNGIKKAWIGIRDAFKGGSFMDGIKQIGKTILAFWLSPLEAILKVVNKLSGGKIGGGALEKISGLRDNLSSGDFTKDTDALNPDATIENVRTERIEKTKNEKVDIQVSASKGSDVEILEDSTNKVQLTPTLGWM